MLRVFWSTYFMAFVVVIFNAACADNLFRNFTDYSTDEAHFSQAMTYLNASNWDKAVEEIDKTTTSYQARRNTRYIKACAYAGKCGLNTVAMIQAFEEIGTLRLFPFFLKQFAGQAKTAVHVTACRNAESQLRLISDDPNARLASENFLMTLIEFAKLGVIFNKSVDADDDGNMDAGYGNMDHCTDPTMVADADVNEVITGLAQIIASLPLAGINAGDITALTDACVALEAINPLYNFCTVLNTSDATANHRKGVRTLIGPDDSTGIGLGNCIGTIGACACP